MKLRWLSSGLISAVSSVLIVSTAHAAELESWNYDSDQHQLEFSTDVAVQPRAQFLANPAQIIIDLPGISVDDTAVHAIAEDGIASVQITLVRPQVTRIVLDVAPEYQFDPAQISIRGLSQTEWIVQLPTPERIEGSSEAALPPTTDAASYRAATSEPVAPEPDEVIEETVSQPSSMEDETQVETIGLTEAVGSTEETAPQLDDIQVTPDGFFFHTSEAVTQVEQTFIPAPSRDEPAQLRIDLIGVVPSAVLQNASFPINRHGVSQLRVERSPGATATQITLSLIDEPNDRPEWQIAEASRGVVAIPPITLAETESDRQPTESLVQSQQQAAANEPAVIQSVSLSDDQSQLLISANRPITFTTGWERPSLDFRITIPDAQLAEGITPPPRTEDSPFLRVRLEQEDPDTVVILVKPAVGVRLGDVLEVDPQQIAVALPRRQVGVPSVPPVYTPTTPPGDISLPDVQPDNRVLVVIDPGHGGTDPGAIGIGGLKEIDVILPISQEVTALLQEQGVQVIMTRQDDRFISLEGRTQLANQADADLFVSIHANSMGLGRPDVNGVETYYYSSGESLAQTIHNSVIQGTGATDRGVRRARFYVLRNTSMPAVLVEVGFVTGDRDSAQLSDPSYRSQMAQAIARGILQYVQQRF